MRETYNGNRSGAIPTGHSDKVVPDTRSGSLSQQQPDRAPEDSGLASREAPRYVIVSERGELKLKRA
jgi:hypothetical protein